MFCTKCGVNLTNDAKFCAGCGTKVVGIPLTTGAPVSGNLNATAASLPPARSTGCSSAVAAPAMHPNIPTVGKGVKIFAAVTLGGLGLLIIALIISHPNDFHGTSSNSASAAPVAASQSVEPSQNQVLDNAALGLLQNGDVGLGSLCDKIYDQSLHRVVYGTIAAGSTRLPAIKAQYEFMCVNPVDGSREQNSSFWIVLGDDTLSDKFRCVKIAGKDVVDEVAAQCDFKS